MKSAEILKNGTPRLTVGDDRVYIRRIWTPGGNAVTGIANFEIMPGESYNGWAYEELRALGNGFHELPVRKKAATQAG